MTTTEHVIATSTEDVDPTAAFEGALVDADATLTRAIEATPLTVTGSHITNFVGTVHAKINADGDVVAYTATVVLTAAVSTS